MFKSITCPMELKDDFLMNENIYNYKFLRCSEDDISVLKNSSCLHLVSFIWYFAGDGWSLVFMVLTPFTPLLQTPNLFLAPLLLLKFQRTLRYDYEFTSIFVIIFCCITRINFIIFVL